MTIYCIASTGGADGTQTNVTQTSSALDWSKADTSLANLLSYDAAALTTSGNIIYVAYDHSQTQASALTFTCPTSGAPVIMISADRVATPTYRAPSAYQFQSTGSNDITIDGSFAGYGIWLDARDIILGNDANESMYCRGMRFAVQADRQLLNSTTGTAHHELIDCIFDLTNDLTTPRTTAPISTANSGAAMTINGGSFVNSGYRTGTIFTGGGNTRTTVIGLDMSGFTNGTTCEILNGGMGTQMWMHACKFPASYVFVDSTTRLNIFNATATGCGTGDTPSSVINASYFGDLASSTSIYRTGGNAVEGEASAWNVTTTAACTEGSPYRTPWCSVGYVAAGSKTFSIAITNDSAALTDAQAWIEIWYLATNNSGLMTRATDQRATITTVAANQTTDSTSTWNGSGPAFTYKQTLATTVTVGEEGQYMARVVFGKASIAANHYCYVDPRVTVA